MFSATFIGHQGWLLGGRRGRLLVDPLLVESFGHGGRVGVVYPPRRLELAAFPPIDAVLLTHEHEDHFNIPSLNRIDRAVPILLPRNASSAARDILAEMGFSVRLVGGGEQLAVGDLELSLFAPDHVGARNGDEWETLQLLVRDTGGHGSFFAAVDVKPTAAALRALPRQLGIYCHSNNCFHWGSMHAGPVAQPYDSLDLAQHILAEDSALRRDHHITPAATVLCGGGMAFTGDRAWMNRNVFAADSDRVCAALAALAPERLFLSAEPGDTLTFLDGRVVDRSSADYVRPLAAERWPSREYQGDVDLVEQYQPASGRHSLEDGETAELETALEDYARYLYARDEFRGLYSQDRDAAIALVLLTDGDWRVFEYQPHACRFAPVECDDPMARYAAGVECWATDLLDLFRGHLNVTAVVFGRWRTWSTIPQAPLRFKLWEYFHPLRRPRAFSTLYRRLLAAEPREVERVRAASAEERPAEWRRTDARAEGDHLAGVE